MRIALDAMGGDHAPGPIVAGAVQAVADVPELHVVLVGDQAQIEPLLPAERARLDILHCSQVVGMDEKPIEALRRKPDNSIKRCWELLATRKVVDGIVSAGNTGAVVAGGYVMRGMLPHVERPGIAAVLPTDRGRCVLVDVGANIAPKPEHLFQYGIMGRIYAQNILQVENPRIGLMNIGEEQVKGHELAQSAHAMFNQSAMKDHFIGNIEGRDIHKGVADVVVCDGFVGNVLLKYSEGVFAFLMELVHRELLAHLNSERDRVEQAWQEMALRYDYSSYGGAPLLGINGACIICHGSSGKRAICNALKVAAQYARANVNGLINDALEANPPPVQS